MTLIDTIRVLIEKKTILGPYTLLEFKSNEPYDQKPGQYCIVHYNKKGGGLFTRPYSIASAPRQDGLIQLCVLHKGDPDTATAIENLSEGDLIEISPAGGNFPIPSHDDDAVFIAGGSGITPLRSMIQWRLDQTQKNTTLLYGCQNGFEIPYAEDFRALDEKFPNFTVKLYADDKANSDVMPGTPLSHIDDYIDIRANYFLCGPPAMIESARNVFEKNGIPKDQVHTDKY